MINESAKSFVAMWRIGLLGLMLCLPMFSAVAYGADEAESASDATHAAAEGDHGGEGHGPEQPAWHANLSLFSAIVFLAFLLILTTFAWKPLARNLDARERRIRDDIAGAEAAREKAERMLAEHAAKLDHVQDEVKAILAEARRDAEVARQNILSSAQSEADATKNRAISEIERARDQALKELFDTMAVGVADATEHVLGHGLDDNVQQRLIDEALVKFEQRNTISSN